VGALAHCDDGIDVLASPATMNVADDAKEKNLMALPVKQQWAHAIPENRRWQCNSRD
jgi:hypothetical protein